MVSTTLNRVTLLAPEKSGLAHLKSWYEDLEDSEVKRVIVKVRWRELKSLDSSRLKVYVVVRHPNRKEADSLNWARENGLSADILKAAQRLNKSFEE